MAKFKYSSSDIIEYITLKILIFITRLLPLAVALKTGEFIGNSVYLIDKKHRAVAMDNLLHAFKTEKTEEELNSIIKNLYKNIGKGLMEFLCISRLSNGKIYRLVEVEGKANFENALAKNKGIVVIVPHFGNWELAGATFPTMARSVAIAFPQANQLTDRVINNIRRSSGLEVVFTGAGIKGVLKALKEKAAVGFLADQNAGDGGVFVNFFGRPASTAKGPAAFALKTGAPMIMGLMIRKPDGKYKLHITGEIIMEKTGDYEKDIIINTQKWSSLLENYIREYPDHWFWVHRRWKTQPKKQAPSY